MDKKKKKRKKKKSKILKIILVLFLIAGAVVFAFISPIFNIEKIEVHGNEKIESETIISLSGLRIGENIFKNRSSEVEKKIKEEPYIENVKIEKKIPGTIDIKITERKISYQVNIIDSYVYIDYQGYILEKSTQAQEVPIIEGLKTEQNEILNGKKLSSQDINYLNDILKIVHAANNVEIYDQITKIIIENNTYILFLKDENKYAYLGNVSEITNKLLYVKAIMKEEKGKTGNIYVDGAKPRFRDMTQKQEEQVQNIEGNDSNSEKNN